MLVLKAPPVLKLTFAAVLWSCFYLAVILAPLLTGLTHMDQGVDFG